MRESALYSENSDGCPLADPFRVRGVPILEAQRLHLRILIAGAACLALIQGATAQSAPEGLVKTRAAFAAVVVANNEKAAAELSAFPLINRVYKEMPVIRRSEFRGLFKTYRELGKCLKSVRLQPEKTPQGKKTGNWLVDCGGNLVLFGQKSGRWLHIGYENVNE
jgi:hypothetical protein